MAIRAWRANTDEDGGTPQDLSCKTDTTLIVFTLPEDVLKKSMAAAAAVFALAALITPGQASAVDCPANRLCLYSGPNQQSTRTVYSSAQRCYALPHFTQPNGAQSAHNRSGLHWEIYNANGRLLLPAIAPYTKRNFTIGDAAVMRELCWYDF